MRDRIDGFLGFDGATLSTEGLLAVALAEDVQHRLFSGCEHDVAVDVDGVSSPT